MFSARLREAVAAKGYTLKKLEQETKIPQRTLKSWISASDPRIPRADEAARLARVLGTTVEALTFGEEPSAVGIFVPYGDIIQDLNSLPDHRLDDVRRLIAPWANEARGAAQQAIDIVADLKVLPPSRLEDVRRLVKPWAEEARQGGMSQERDSRAG